MRRFINSEFLIGVDGEPLTFTEVKVVGRDETTGEPKTETSEARLSLAGWVLKVINDIHRVSGKFSAVDSARYFKITQELLRAEKARTVGKGDPTLVFEDDDHEWLLSTFWTDEGTARLVNPQLTKVEKAWGLNVFGPLVGIVIKEALDVKLSAGSGEDEDGEGGGERAEKDGSGDAK